MVDCFLKNSLCLEKIWLLALKFYQFKIIINKTKSTMEPSGARRRKQIVMLLLLGSRLMRHLMSILRPQLCGLEGAPDSSLSEAFAVF
jgi:hypothetical protein